MTKLGQHFLRSRKIINEIIKAAELKKDDLVLEVGPGKGILTEALIQKAGKVIAVEKDPRLIQYLEEKFKGIKNLKIVYGDILKIDNCKLIENCKLSRHSGIPHLAGKIENYKVVANIPYYITSRFLRNFLSSQTQPELMVLMLQREVAERIAAADGKESILSISVKSYGEPKIIKNISAKYFWPRPKVNSAILKISNISHSFFRKNKTVRDRISNIEETKFFELVKKGFSSKRKMLKNNLNLKEVGPASAACLPAGRAGRLQSLKRCGLSEKIRAEELSPENWRCLYNAFYPHPQIPVIGSQIAGSQAHLSRQPKP